MNKNDLLKHIAETGYNVGFGAKKHFSTYDIVDKLPGFISFLSMIIGVYALFVDALSTKFMSASLVVLGIVGLYISFYDSNKQEYAQIGTRLTVLFNALKQLYADTKAASEESITEYQARLNEIENEYYETCISKQILFSDWYAHYKFFWQHQIDWINEQKSFKFMRDKIPLTFTLTILVIVSFMTIYFYKTSFCN